MTDADRIEALLSQCRDRLAAIERVHRAQGPRTGRSGLMVFLERERAVYTFGVMLLEEVLQPSGETSRLFP